MSKRKGILKAETLVERHEAKYIIPQRLVADIREFIRPFCDPDPNGHGDPPEYTIVTLQLDGPSLPLHYAKEREALNRFKLRVRTYGDPVGKAPVFLEVKRKYGSAVVKSRTPVPFEKWSGRLIDNQQVTLDFKNDKQVLGFLEFVRLAREIDARPVVLIRYVRESYFGKNDHYARLSFDRHLQYQPVPTWTSWGRDRAWLSMDTCLQQNKLHPFSGVVLELKTLTDAPQWMLDVVTEFDLSREGNCKYSTAIWSEAIFRGTPDLPLFAEEFLRW